MIQDLDGATSEPSRRRHVAMLSAAVAAAAIVMLYALVAPAPRMDTPPAAAPTTNPTSGTVFTIASGATRVTLDQLSQTRGDLMTSLCVVGPGSTPTVHLLFDREGQPVAAYTGGATGRFIPLPQAYVGSGWLTVPCDTSDVFAPRINRAR